MALNNKYKLFMVVAMTILLWKIFKHMDQQIKTEKAEENLERDQPNKLLVTVYYEALCPDSRNFIIKQLVPTFDQLESYIDLQLIPYGKAETIVTTYDDYIFKCQHGETECEANIFHGCSISKVRGYKRQLTLIACMIKNNINPLSAFTSCGNELEEYKDILQCSESIEGRKLLMRNGELTKALQPKITFIPTITLDNDIDNQILILKNLMRQVCQRLEKPPKECDSK